MPTGYEVQAYQDLRRATLALEKIADVMKSMNTAVAYLVAQAKEAEDADKD